MKRILLASLMAALLLAAWPMACAEQTQIEVYVSEGAMPRETVTRLVDMAQAAYPQAKWSAVFEEDVGMSLRELVLADCAPQVAICAPQEAQAWESEGLLVPLAGRVSDLSLMQDEVVDACTQGDTLFMAPLLARHRRVAVNASLFFGTNMNYLLSQRDHPVWMPTELFQVVEEASLAGRLALEIWLPQEDTSAGIEAFIQSLYGGRLIQQDGSCTADTSQMIMALTWVRDMASSGMIGVVRDRQTALEHFVNGQTLLFIDWTDEDSLRYAHEMMQDDIELREMPYPTADGRSVRSFDLVGAAVFAGHDARAMSLAAQGVALWSDAGKTQAVLGDRGIWRDDALWLPCLSAQPSGATMRSLFAEGVRDVLALEREPQDALRRLAAVYEAVAGK